MNQRENIICWNCRVAKSGESLREIRDLIGVHQPVLIVLLEPRVSGDVADGICKKLGKKVWIRFEANVFSGGIWMFRDEDGI